MHNLRGKIIAITGASSGLGRQMALDAAAAGAVVVLLSRSAEKLSQVAGEIERLTGKSAYYDRLNVGDVDDVNKVFHKLIANVGVPDVLINNAGFAVFDSFIDANMKDIQEMFDVNVLGLAACTKAVLPYMIERNKGHIINIASQAGKIATPKSSAYAATKHAVLGMTNSLRMELHDTNIYVSAVNPGPIRTPFFERADKSGSYVKNIKKMMLPVETVSKKVLRLIGEPKRELNLPGWMNAAAHFYQLFPGFVEKVGGKRFHQK